MITISISVILLTVGMPGFSAMIKNQVLSAEARTFSMTLALARSQAQSRKTQMVLCKSPNGTSCSRLSTDFWESGWILFVDADVDGTRDVGDDAETILRHFEGRGNGFRLRPTAAYTNYIAFGLDGRAFGSGDTTPPTSGSYRFCDARGADHARTVTISPIGRSRVAQGLGAPSCP